MKLILCLTVLAGLQLAALAQNVSDCTDIAASLDTTPIDPITGEYHKELFVWWLLLNFRQECLQI